MRKPRVYWGQYLGLQECPYARRWALDLVVFSIRLHHFFRSDDPRYRHDHPWWYCGVVLKGGYYDRDGQTDKFLSPGRPFFRKSERAHYVDPVPGGSWSLVFTGPVSRHWGFWVGDKWKRAHRFFFDYGHPPCDDSIPPHQ